MSKCPNHNTCTCKCLYKAKTIARQSPHVSMRSLPRPGTALPQGARSPEGTCAACPSTAAVREHIRACACLTHASSCSPADAFRKQQPHPPAPPPTGAGSQAGNAQQRTCLNLTHASSSPGNASASRQPRTAAAQLTGAGSPVGTRAVPQCPSAAGLKWQAPAGACACATRAALRPARVCPTTYPLCWPRPVPGA